jgi:hypothetical protein
MFIQAIVLAVVIGLVLGGSLRNLANIKIEGISIIAAAFLMDAAVIWSVRSGLLETGSITMLADLSVYLLLLLFVLRNRRSPYIMIAGAGFLLNAVVIFGNGGVMPVGDYALQAAGLTLDVSTQGHYAPVGEATRFRYLGDIIPYTFLNINIISIGDIVSALGVMLLIIANMRSKNDSDSIIISFFGTDINKKEI